MASIRADATKLAKKQQRATRLMEMTALNIAVDAGYPSMVRLLLHYGASPDQLDVTGKPIICNAIAAGGTSKGPAVFEFAEELAIARQRRLELAPALRFTKIARKLIRAGARVALGLNRYGYSVLHYACEVGSPKLVRMLLDHGALAELNLRASTMQQHNSPLHFVVCGADLIRHCYDSSCAESLANLSVANSQRKEAAVIALLVARGAVVDQRDTLGRTPLALVFDQDKPDLSTVKALLNAGADTKLKTADGQVLAEILRPYAAMLKSIKL